MREVEPQRPINAAALPARQRAAQLPSEADGILSKWPRNGPKPKKKGCEVAHHAEDMHLRLAIRNGVNALRDRLRALL